jgi:hypothetical protein
MDSSNFQRGQRLVLGVGTCDPWIDHPPELLLSLMFLSELGSGLLPWMLEITAFGCGS